MTHSFRAAAVVLAATATLLTACSGATAPSGPIIGPAPTTAPPTTAPTTTGAPAATRPAGAGNPDRCTTAELSASLGDGDGDGDAGAGSVFRPLLLTNTGDRTCELTGFPGVSYVTGDSGEQVGPPAAMDGERGGPVRLAVGQPAEAQLRLVNVGNFDAEVCRPTPVRGLRVYPPGDTASEFVPLETTGCAATPPGDQLAVQTLLPG